MVGLRRIAVCFSIVFFVFGGIVVLGRVAHPAGAAWNEMEVQEYVDTFVPAGISSQASTGAPAPYLGFYTSTLISQYFPYVLRSSWSKA